MSYWTDGLNRRRSPSVSIDTYGTTHTLKIGGVQFLGYKLSFPNLGLPSVRHTTDTWCGVIRFYLGIREGCY